MNKNLSAKFRSLCFFEDKDNIISEQYYCIRRLNKVNCVLQNSACGDAEGFSVRKFLRSDVERVESVSAIGAVF